MNNRSLIRTCFCIAQERGENGQSSRRRRDENNKNVMIILNRLSLFSGFAYAADPSGAFLPGTAENQPKRCKGMVDTRHLFFVDI